MRTLSLAILLFSFFTSFSQQSKSKQDNERRLSTRFGFKGGLNRSMLDGFDQTGAKTGYRGTELYGSFFSDTRLNESIGLENELLVSWTDDYHFIEFPIHMKYHFTNKWKAFAGPKLDFIADNDNDPFERNYRFRNFGVSGELGLQYYFTDRFFAEARYAKSFIKQVTDPFLDINEGKRNVYRIGAGIRF